MTSETSKTEAAVPCGIYREVDGFYYFDPVPGQGCYSAYSLRCLADVLDEMNRPWAAKVAAALAAKPVESPPVQSPDIYLRCGRCGKQVSTAVPADTIVRAWLECPECLAAEPVQPPAHPEQGLPVEGFALAAGPDREGQP